VPPEAYRQLGLAGNWLAQNGRHPDHLSAR